MASSGRSRGGGWRILEPSEVAWVRKAFTDPQARAIFTTLVLTGIRRFELQALRWRDVKLVESVLAVRKSKARRASGPSRSPPRSLRSCGSTVAVPPSRAMTSWSSAPRVRHQDRPRVVRGRVPRGAERGRDHRLRVAVPRPAPKQPDQPGRGRRVAHRAVDAPGTPRWTRPRSTSSGRDGLPRRGRGSRATASRERGSGEAEKEPERVPARDPLADLLANPPDPSETERTGPRLVSASGTRGTRIQRSAASGEPPGGSRVASTNMCVLTNR
jgi:hypothetical protein